MINRFKYTNTNKRYYTLDYYNKNKYGKKVSKISLNGGFSCPNKDGTKGNGGCIYCSKLGSGDFAGSLNKSILEQFNEIKEVMNRKWPNTLYIPYFQANTNTYAPVDVLKEKYEPLIKLDNVVGLSIATRCDAITDECLDYLEDLSKRTNLTIELGLQTIHEKTSNLINRGHTLTEFDDMVKKLRQRNIEVVVHIINGLPYETKEMMLETIKHVNKLDIQGIKIHMLHVIKNTKLEDIYKEEKFPILTKEEYIDIVCDQLELLNENIVVHRLTGDAKQDDLIEPIWTLNKIDVLNGIDKELAKRNTYQGFQKSILNFVKQQIDEHLKPNDLVIDATTGNGNDTLYISKILKDGFIFGFDIQKDAIENTDKLLKENNIENYKLFNASHEDMLENLKEYENKISLIIFNLGYLPNGDKSITTTWETTKKAIDDGLKLLNNKGIILITVYPGHNEGSNESKNLQEYLKDKNVSYYYNEYGKNDKAPYLIKITK